VCRPLEAGKRIAGKKIEKFRKLRIKVAPSKKTHKSNCKEVLKISMCVEIPIYCSYDDDFFCCFIKKLQLRECIKGWFQTQWNVSNSTTIVSWWWWSFLYVGLIKFNFQGSLDFFIKKNKFKRNLKVCEKKNICTLCVVLFFFLDLIKKSLSDYHTQFTIWNSNFVSFLLSEEENKVGNNKKKKFTWNIFQRE
jgi:hypothetical protein